jgi:carboxyl-terminal processing protease
MERRGIMKRRVSIPMVVFLVVTAMFIGTQYNSLISGTDIYEQLRKFNDVVAYTERFYVEELNSEELIESAIRGMLNSLDPHSVYIPAKQMQRVQEEFRGSFEGIGIQFEILRDTINVIAPVSGGPSERLGIFSGDRIVRIDGESAIGWTNEDVQSSLRGPKGTKVNVEIVRAGISDLLEFEITRDKIPLYTVDASFMFDDQTGYIRVNRFAATTYNEFIQEMDKLHEQGMTHLVLDLRNNPGGFLEEAFKMADVFIPSGKKIVYTRGRNPQFNDEYNATGGSRYENMPLIILINSGSASASEIVAGAVQDWDRGLIVGDRSFGKGLVQRQFDLRDGSAFRLTTAKYFTPSGRLIQRPYEQGADAYRLEAWHRDMDDEEIEDLYVTPLEADTSEQPVYYTDGGRIVYGGGGITPDIIVRSTQWTELGTRIIANNLIRLYHSIYMERHGALLQRRYKDDFEKFRNEFTITDDHFDDFIRFVEENNVTVTEENLEKDKIFLKSFLKSEIGRALHGDDGLHASRLESDEQFSRAVSLFPELHKLISAETGR